MEKHDIKLFPTLVQLYREVLSPAQLGTIAAHCLSVEAGQHGAFIGEASSSFAKDSYLIEDLEKKYPGLQGLQNGLSKLISSYALEYGFEGVKLTNSWFNIQRVGSVLKHHVHTDSKVSGALFIQADSQSSKLHLENPNPFLNYIRPDNFNVYTLEYAQFQAVAGDLVLFPSWIKHGSGFEANQSSHRIVISLNAF
jgi:uncharacterized protein (TIGR02466 family)